MYGLESTQPLAEMSTRILCLACCTSPWSQYVDDDDDDGDNDDCEAIGEIRFFGNPILFAVCTSTFRR
jgi:hypothetical protein